MPIARSPARMLVELGRVLRPAERRCPWLALSASPSRPGSAASLSARGRCTPGPRRSLPTVLRRASERPLRARRAGLRASTASSPGRRQRGFADPAGKAGASGLAASHASASVKASRCGRVSAMRLSRRVSAIAASPLRPGLRHVALAARPAPLSAARAPPAATTASRTRLRVSSSSDRGRVQGRLALALAPVLVASRLDDRRGPPWRRPAHPCRPAAPPTGWCRP